MISITSHDVFLILTQDAVSRRRKHWPLITFEQYKNAYAKVYNQGDRDYDQKIDKSMLAIRLRTNIRSLPIFLNATHPIVLDILNRFKGNVVLAGGAARMMLFSSEKPKDYDFFFVNPSKDANPESVRKNVKEIIAYVTNLVCVNQYNVSIATNAHVTTLRVALRNARNFREREPVILQFIHRVYPSIDTVIGGFDLAQSAVAFDGTELYMTPLACYSITHHVEIVNISRRSTTYENRLNKYAQRYNLSIIVPGTNLAKICEVTPNFKMTGGVHKLPYLRLTRSRRGLIYCYNEGPAKSDYEETNLSTQLMARFNNTKAAVNDNLDGISSYRGYGEHAALESIPYKVYESVKEFRTIFSTVKQIKRWFRSLVDILIAVYDNDDALWIVIAGINEKIVKNCKLAEIERKEISLLYQEPGRQWTSSINPIIKEAREWYGECYVPFHVLVPYEIASALRMLRLRKDGNLFSRLPKDILHLLLQHLAENYAEDGWCLATGYQPLADEKILTLSRSNQSLLQNVKNSPKLVDELRQFFKTN